MLSMKKINNWLFKSKVDLSKKWWHRLFKVFFIVAIIVFVIYLISFLSGSYSQVRNQWSFVDILSARLSKEPFSGKVVSIKDLYEKNEVISEEKYPSKMSFSLADKSYLQPFSSMFLENGQSENFCSDELYTNISNIASTNNINLFSTTNPTFKTLYPDVDKFTTYLKNNAYNIKCVMVDSYSITNENDKISTFTFLRPVETSAYSIYSYKDNLSGFILSIFFSIVVFLLCLLFTILIYYKVFLYIIYGKIENLSSQ